MAWNNRQFDGYYLSDYVEVSKERLNEYINSDVREIDGRTYIIGTAVSLNIDLKFDSLTAVNDLAREMETVNWECFGNIIQVKNNKVERIYGGLELMRIYKIGEI